MYFSVPFIFCQVSFSEPMVFTVSIFSGCTCSWGHILQDPWELGVLLCSSWCTEPVSVRGGSWDGEFSVSALIYFYAFINLDTCGEVPGIIHSHVSGHQKRELEAFGLFVLQPTLTS